MLCLIFFQKLILYTRRTIGIIISIILMIAAPAAVSVVTIWYNTLNNIFSYTTAIILAAINFIFPKLIDLLILFENWDDTRVKNFNSTGRTYIVKVATTVTLIIQVFKINEEKLPVHKCAANEAGITFWQVHMITLISSSITFILTNFLLRIITKSKQEFIVSSNAIELLYLQAVTWIGTVMSPMLPFLAVLDNLILFFVKYIVVCYYYESTFFLHGLFRC